MPVTITIDLKNSRVVIGAVIAIIGGLITVVGSVLPWFESFLGGSLGGLETGDGKVTLTAGVLVVILGAVACWLFASQVDKWPSRSTGALLYLALAGLAVTVGMIIRAYRSGAFDPVDAPFGGSVTLISFGAGIWITLAGSIIAVGGGAFAFLEARKAQASDQARTAAWIGGAAVLSIALAVLGASEVAGSGPRDAVGTASGGGESSVPSVNSGGLPPNSSDVAPSTETVNATVQSPTGNVRCKIDAPPAAARAFCVVLNLRQWGELQPYGGATLDSDTPPGEQFFVGECAGARCSLGSGPVLPYGEGEFINGFYCESEPDAFRCTHTSPDVGMSMNRDGITRTE